MDKTMTNLASLRKSRVKTDTSLISEVHDYLIHSLCQELNQSGVRYCHWKSNANIEKSLSGDGDLDLLVHRQDIQVFNQILMGLGFKEAEVPASRRIPGIRDYYGYDPRLKELVHVHAHFQLTVGHDATKKIHLNIEEDYLTLTTLKGLIKVPAVEFEYILLVIRMALKHLTWDSMLRLESQLSRNERYELAWLKEQVSREKVEKILISSFPTLRTENFFKCADVLSDKRISFRHVIAGQRIANQLRDYSRLNSWVSRWREFSYRFVEAYKRRVSKKKTRKTFTSGGLFIAIVGGDGSGKTTLVSSLYPWLSKEFETMRIHLGKPKWSILTIMVRGFLKIFRLAGSQPFLEAPLVYTNDQEKIKFPGYPWAIREVCTARDRNITYRKARRFATNGGIVISDRFPLTDIHFMDGPQIERMYGSEPRTRLIQWLIQKEKGYYRGIQRPDLMLILKVDPEIAAKRKNEESWINVIARTGEIWSLDWSYPGVHVIDASISQEEVFSTAKALIWSYL